MLSAYPSDKNLEQSQQAQLQQIRTDIATLQTNLRSQEDSLTDLLAHAADLEHAGKPIPPTVNRRIAEQRATVNGERNALAQRRTDLANSQAKFTAQLQRYRALRAKYQNGDPQQQ
jgi:small-conductance mechanosensitive channel